jgi:hypothetical protein
MTFDVPAGPTGAQASGLTPAPGSAGMTPTGMTPTGMTPTGMTPAGTTPSGMTPSGMTPSGMTPSVPGPDTEPGDMPDPTMAPVAGSGAPEPMPEPVDPGNTSATPTIPALTAQCPDWRSGTISFMGLSGITVQAGSKASGPTAPMVFYWPGTGSFGGE